MDYAVEIDLLSQKFLSDYLEAQYPELMHKLGRPYACLLIDSHDGYFICVPYRSAIAHQNCYCFSDTERSRTSRSGLDYSKIVVIADPAYLDEQPAIIDQDEYNETMKNMPTIIHEVLEYVNTGNL